MSPIEALHCAARRYCIERHRRWTDAYADLHARGADTVPAACGPYRWVYSDEAYRTFPRYNVLEAIRDEVERFVPADFASFAEARDLIAAAGETGANHFTKKPNDDREAATMAEERAAFAAYVRSLGPDDLARVDPLPFRRVLSNSEAQQRVDEIKARWGWWYGGATDCAGPLPPYLLLQDSRIDNRRGDIADVLARHGVSRLFELPETEVAREIELELAGFELTEGYWLTPGAPWLVTVSHEDSITIGGEWLVDEIRRRWPDWRELIYRGCDGQDEPAM